MQILNGRTIAFLGGSIAADFRAQLYRSIEFLQLNYFDKKQVGAITSRVTQDTDRVWGFLTEGVPYFLINGLLLLAIAGFLVTVNWKLTLCILAPIPVVVAIGGIFWKSVAQLFTRVGQKWARIPYSPERVADGHSGRQSVRPGRLREREVRRPERRAAGRRDCRGHALEHDFRRHVAVCRHGQR